MKNENNLQEKLLKRQRKRQFKRKKKNLKFIFINEAKRNVCIKFTKIK